MNSTRVLTNKVERNSGIELFKIFAIAIIVLSHSLPVEVGDVIGETSH